MTPPKRTAKELGLPTGEAVMRDGKVSVLPPNHNLDRVTDRVTDVGPAHLPQTQLQQTAVTQTVVKTSHVDRAEGFHISTSRLSWAFIVAGVLVSMFGYKAPFLSLVTLGFAFAFYVGAWVLGWLVYQFVSPDGATILHALLGYRLVRHEQKNRHKRQSRQNPKR